MKLLIIDDNKAVLRALRLVLAADFDTVAVSDPTLIPAILAPDDTDVVLLDMNFGTSRLDGSDGLFWLSRIRAMENPPAVVLITAFGEVPLAVEAMKLGADDFVTKPWDNDALRATLTRAVARSRQARHEREALKDAERIRGREDQERHMSLDDLKATHIRRVLDQCGGNITQASEILGIKRQTIYNLLKKDK